MGSDVAGMKCRAEKDGDEYILNGSKFWITNGGYADYITVLATVDPEKKHKGIGAFIVDTKSEGVRLGEHIPKLGQRSSNTVAISLRNVRIPKENILMFLDIALSIVSFLTSSVPSVKRSIDLFS